MKLIGTLLGRSPTGGGGGTVVYRMRAIDGTLTAFVFWTTTTIDGTGALYPGPGPLTDIVVQNVIGQV